MADKASDFTYYECPTCKTIHNYRTDALTETTVVTCQNEKHVMRPAVCVRLKGVPKGTKLARR